MFYQIEGLAVDEGITLADLKGMLTSLRQAASSAPERKVRFRCDYFPFVEPGVEMAIACMHLRRRRLPRLQRRPAGWRSWAPAWCTPRS